MLQHRETSVRQVTAAPDQRIANLLLGKSAE
jgi:hypothetical protein